MFYIFLLQKKTHPADAIYPLSLKTSTKQCYFREFGHNIIIQQVHVLGFLYPILTVRSFFIDLENDIVRSI